MQFLDTRYTRMLKVFIQYEGENERIRIALRMVLKIEHELVPDYLDDIP